MHGLNVYVWWTLPVGSQASFVGNLVFGSGAASGLVGPLTVRATNVSGFPVEDGHTVHGRHHRHAVAVRRGPDRTLTTPPPGPARHRAGHRSIHTSTLAGGGATRDDSAMDATEYLQGAAQRMQQDGSQVSWVGLPGGQALVGYRSQFKLSLLATKLHLFTVLYPTALATDADLAALSRDAVNYAKATKGALRGFQSGVAIIPALVADTVSESARAAALARPKKEFAAFLLPAIVDLAAGQTVSYQGRIVWGGIYSSWLRARVATTLPPPR